MRYLISFLLIGLFTFGLIAEEASAARFGGGRSFGVQRSHSSLFSSRQAQSSKAVGKSPSTNRWGGMLGGLLIGGLLASLFMGHGLGTGLLTWLMLGAAVFFAIRFYKNRMQQPAFQSARSSPFQQNAFNQNSFNNASLFSASTAERNDTSSGYPADFVPETFLRTAKVTFIRLQASFDQKNLQDLGEFTAPDVFAEIKMQLDERGATPNTTEVVNLEADLLDASKQVHDTIASVRFSGFIKENNAPMASFDEIWHFRQFANSTNWVVAGIQQEIVGSA